MDQKIESQEAYEALENYIHSQLPLQQLVVAKRIIARMLDRMTPEKRADVCNLVIR